jgi:hypothetical protein
LHVLDGKRIAARPGLKAARAFAAGAFLTDQRRAQHWMKYSGEGELTMQHIKNIEKKRAAMQPSTIVATIIWQGGEFGFANFGVRLATTAIDLPLQRIGERSAVVAAQAVPIVVAQALTT